MSEIASSAAPAPSATAEKIRFYGLWVAAALLLMVLPQIFSSGASLTTFSLIGISIIFSLSYNILLGQTGMLSFGHAVYYGLGGFLAIHAINIVAKNKPNNGAKMSSSSVKPEPPSGEKPKICSIKCINTPL